MLRTRFKKVLFVAPEISHTRLTADYERVKYVHALNQIFPSIFDLNPNLIVFDYNYIQKDMEKIVRRIRTNAFYSKIKICCYKNNADTKTDSLLKAIGVNYFIYEDELKAAQKSENIPSIFTEILDKSLLTMLINEPN